MRSKTAKVMLLSAFFIFLVTSSSFAGVQGQTVSADATTDGNVYGLKVLVLGSTHQTTDDEAKTLENLGMITAVLKGTTEVKYYLSRAYLRKFDVLYLATRWWDIKSVLDLKWKASAIRSWLRYDGGGLVVGQCNPGIVPYTPAFIPPLRYTSKFYPSTDVKIKTTAGLSHQVTRYLSNTYMPDIYDRIPIRYLDASYTVLARHKSYSLVSLAVAKYGKGRIAVACSNWRYGVGTVFPKDPSIIIERIFMWAGRTSRALLVSERAYQETMNPTLKQKILTSFSNVRYDLKDRWQWSVNWYYYKGAAWAMLQNLKWKEPQVVLQHSHGGYSGTSVYLVYEDNSKIWASNINALAYGIVNGGKLFYAGVCYGAKYSDLGNAFVNAGYACYLGYTVSVYTDRNRQFYEYFFDMATRGYSLGKARDLAKAKFSTWSDVCTATFIYGVNPYKVYLTTEDRLNWDGDAETEMTEESVAPLMQDGGSPVDEKDQAWKERRVVSIAMKVPEVKGLLKDRAEMTHEIEKFGNVWRVVFKDGPICVYGVDVNTETEEVVEKGTLD